MHERLSVGEAVKFFDELLSFTEASKIWGLSESTLRKAVANSRFTIGVDCKKFGKQWVITKDAMAREYGGWSKLIMYDTTQRAKKKEQE